MIIDFNDETNLINATDINVLREIIIFTSQKENLPPTCEVSITFVFDDDIQSYNKQYRQIDEPTDVLSFPMQQSLKDEHVPADSELPLLLGDIIISVDRVTKQAKEYNHSFQRELAFLTVHGLLHLLGYTHDTDAEEKEMFEKQEKILGAFKIERD